MEKIRELFKKYREQIAYLFYGVLTTVVNFLIYSLFAYIIFGNGEEYKTAAQTIAWLASVIFAFFTNKFRVFKHEGDSHIAREFLTFFGARAVSGLVEIGGFALLVDGLGINDMMVKIALSVFVVIANYVLSKFLIFKK